VQRIADELKTLCGIGQPLEGNVKKLR
jgi:hypothetical protein